MEFSLAQAIMPDGGVSADWVLVGVVGLAISLMIALGTTIKNVYKDSMESIKLSISELKTEMKGIREDHDRRLDEQQLKLRENELKDEHTREMMKANKDVIDNNNKLMAELLTKLQFLKQ